MHTLASSQISASVRMNPMLATVSTDRTVRLWDASQMDYVVDANPLLKKMERNGIGLKRASFIWLHALYYDKHKRFNDAKKMYNLGIQK